MIGITPTDVEKQYKQSYSYALIDEDNTTFEFKVYGDSYIVFDEIQRMFTHIMVLQPLEMR